MFYGCAQLQINIIELTSGMLSSVHNIKAAKLTSNTMCIGRM